MFVHQISNNCKYIPKIMYWLNISYCENIERDYYCYTVLTDCLFTKQQRHWNFTFWSVYCEELSVSVLFDVAFYYLLLSGSSLCKERQCHPHLLVKPVNIIYMWSKVCSTHWCQCWRQHWHIKSQCVAVHCNIRVPTPLWFCRKTDTYRKISNIGFSIGANALFSIHTLDEECWRQRWSQCMEPEMILRYIPNITNSLELMPLPVFTHCFKF